MTETDSVWIFHGEGARFASGVFTTKDAAVSWIEKGGFRGMLTRYPLNQGCYDWAVENGLFTPKKPHQFSTPFIQNFTTAAQDHEHFPEDDEAGSSGPHHPVAVPPQR